MDKLLVALLFLTSVEHLQAVEAAEVVNNTSTAQQKERGNKSDVDASANRNNGSYNKPSSSEPAVTGKLVWLFKSSLSLKRASLLILPISKFSDVPGGNGSPLR